MGIFDVSHMLGVMIRGADRVEFMEKMCVADLQVFFARLPKRLSHLRVVRAVRAHGPRTTPP